MARSTFPSQNNVPNTPCSDHFWNYNYSILQLQLQLQLHYITLHKLHYTTTTTTATTATTLLHTTLHYTALHYSRLHYTTNYTTPQLQLQLQLHYTMYTTLQLQLRYTTLHPAVVGEVTTATIPTTPKNTTPTTFRSISGFALPSMHHNNSPLR